MSNGDRGGWFFAGVLMTVTGLLAAVYLFSLQDFEGRIRLWMLPLLTFSSDVPWHGPVSVGALVMAWIGYRMARRADAGLPAFAASRSSNQAAATDRVVVGSPAVMPLIGASPMHESQVGQRLEAYIKGNRLWHPTKRGYIQTNDAIRRIVGEKQTVSLIELVTAIQNNLKAFAPKRRIDP